MSYHPLASFSISTSFVKELSNATCLGGGDFSSSGLSIALFAKMESCENVSNASPESDLELVFIHLGSEGSSSKSGFSGQ